jgi:hypothetical protein
MGFGVKLHLKVVYVGLDRRPKQPTLRGLSAESSICIGTGAREQVAGRSGRNGGQSLYV